MFESGKRYLVAQGVVRPPSVITLVALGLSPLYCWALPCKYEFGGINSVIRRACAL